jgi:transposase-like protein
MKYIQTRLALLAALFVIIAITQFGVPVAMRCPTLTYYKNVDYVLGLDRARSPLFQCTACIQQVQRSYYIKKEGKKWKKCMLTTLNSGNVAIFSTKSFVNYIHSSMAQPLSRKILKLIEV